MKHFGITGMKFETKFDNKLIKKFEKNKSLRVIGFDDAPFDKKNDQLVNISGIVCSDTRFEGMLWSHVTRDGDDATDQVFNLLSESKFLNQLDVILFDGIAFGGFNIFDINELSNSLNLPCITVMRRMPDFAKIKNALNNFKDANRRWQLIKSTGQVIEHAPFYFQTAGLSKSVALNILRQSTGNGNVPEALRIAHLIGSAIKTGQSSNRA